MSQIEKMVELLKALDEDNQLIAMGGLMALKAQQDAADDAA